MKTTKESIALKDDGLKDMPQTQIDTRMAKAKPVKLGWSSEEVENITHALNDLLVNYSVHYQKLRNYHWNVKGSDFFDLHIEFEQQYKEAQDHIDDIAERIRVFSKTPVSTMGEYLEQSEIKETTSQLSSEIMVRELIADYTILLGYMFAVIEIASAQHDAGTEEMVKVFIHQIEKHHWMLSAFLAK
ncbi:Dps family protein [Chryseolinea soli]|nr:DNA starvation/stationary phase protection protein [Chryseolinea soli]